MRGRARSLGTIIGSTLIPVLAIMVLHRIGERAELRMSWDTRWLERVGPEVAVAALLRTVGLAMAYWMATSTVLYLIARVAGWTRMANTVGWLTLPVVRRASDRLVAGSLALATVAAPGVAWSNDPTPTTQPAPISMPAEYATPATTLPPSVVDQNPPAEPQSPPHLPPGGVDEPEIVIVADATLEVVVRPGDNLWDLAARRVTNVYGRSAADHEIAPYWVEVLHANGERIRSGDPDLIYPGEVILLPPVRG